MEVNSFSFSSDVVAFGKIVMNSVLEAVFAETLLVVQRSVASLLMVDLSETISLHSQVRAERTKVPLRPYLRGHPGLLPRAISPRNDISVVKKVEDCEGQAGCLLKDGAPLPELVTIAPSSEFLSISPLSELISPDRRFPFEALNQKNQACTENKDGSDTEDDNEDDDGDAEDQDDDDDANDEDFSGEEGGDDDEEGDPEEDPAANGNEGSDDDDEDDDDGDEGGDDDDDDDDDGDEEEEEDDEEEEDQPPAKKRK